MAVRLYVGNLPYNATEAELREHFSAVGPVSGVWIATDRETGRPRGFAFVEYEDRALAEEAVRRFNSKSFGGRPLAVNEARPQERGAGGGAPPPRRPGPPPSGGPPRYGSGPPGGRFDGPPGDGSGPPRPRPAFRPAPSADSGFFPDTSEPVRRTREATPKKKKERDRGREFDKVRPPKQRPIQVASGGRFFSSDDFDEDDIEGTGVEELEGDSLELDEETDDTAASDDGGAEADSETETESEAEEADEADADEPPDEPAKH